MSYPVPLDGRLVHGCYRAAEKCDVASMSVDGLRMVLVESHHVHMNALVEEIRSTGLGLRELVAEYQLNPVRAAHIIEYSDVLLPCIDKSLCDIIAYVENKNMSKENRWRTMYHKMTNETGGIPLPQRFVLYNHFLKLLHQLLARDPNFDLNTLDLLRTRVLELREKRGIAPPPAPAGPLIRPDMVLAPLLQEHNVHWAEKIFSLPLPSRTALKHPKKSRSLGPHQPTMPMPPNAKVIFRRSFDSDALTLIAFINPANNAPYLVLRTLHLGKTWFSIRGIHELCIQRNHSAVELRRWSRSAQAAKLWASLFFLTWEEMILFHCTFASLKAQNSETLEVDLGEYQLRNERRLFQAQIIDDDFKHSLIVYEDSETKGIRLHAAVWEGVLRQCPVWTAFVTHQCTSPTWLVKKSRHRVWLRDVQLYVFCQRYRQHNQRKGREGAFELNFRNEKAAARFMELFDSPSSPTAHTDSDKEAGSSK